MRTRRLPRTFFARDTHVVARALLGKLVVRQIKDVTVSGRIVEVESYVGEHDAASHAARGRTPRTEVMFGPAGYAYVYFIYGMYHCFNIVTDSPGFAAAVLVRALEPVSGLEQMQQWRHTADPQRLTSGPGRLCQALAIDRSFSGEDLVRSQELWIADDGQRLRRKEIMATTRVGVAYAGADALLPWRYYINSSPFVSKR